MRTKVQTIADLNHRGTFRIIINCFSHISHQSMKLSGAEVIQIELFRLIHIRTYWHLAKLIFWSTLLKVFSIRSDKVRSVPNNKHNTFTARHICVPHFIIIKTFVFSLNPFTESESPETEEREAVNVLTNHIAGLKLRIDRIKFLFRIE